MDQIHFSEDAHLPLLHLEIGQDCEGEVRSLGVSTLAFKVISGGENGLLVVENTFHAAGGPAKHLHYDQDEWFSIQQGEFQFEVGAEKLLLKAGDSLMAPRQVPHVWAFTGTQPGEIGRILIAFLPAGKMETFFREVTKANAMPPQDPSLWLAHGMKLLGPPLVV